MSVSNSQFFLAAQLSPARLLSSSNISGTYYNGPGNDGVLATFTVAASSLTIDSVVVEEQDRVILSGQTSAFQNGIYIVESIGSTVVLQRSNDFQSIAQLKGGQYISVSAGTVHAGAIVVLVEPLPGAIGVGDITFVSPEGGVSGPTVAGDFAQFSDTVGTVTDNGLLPSNAAKDVVVMADAAVLVGHIATYVDTAGTISDDAGTAINGGNLQAGLSGTAGGVFSFPAGAGLGSLRLVAVNSAGAFNVTISNASHGQSSVVSIPDGGQATAEFIISDSAGTQLITSGSLQISAGNLSVGSTAGAAGALISFPAGAASGSLRLDAQNNAGDFAISIRNASHGQSTNYVISDIGEAAGSLLASTLNDADPNANLISFDVTVGQAALAAGGSVILLDSSGAKQYKVRELIVNDGGTNFSGGGGDRLLDISDGTTVYSSIPAASLQTLVNSRWGSAGVPFNATVAANTSTVAGADLIAIYSGGAADYTAGSVVISGILQRVA